MLSTVALVLLISAVALLVRLFHLGQPSLWVDEIYSIEHALKLADGQIRVTRFVADLVTLASGVNDVVRPSVDVEAVAGDLEAMYATLSAPGRLVIGCTFPLPNAGLTRHAAPRLQALNALIREAAARHGVRLVEMEGVEMASDLRLWSSDRIHLNEHGHTRLAEAFDAVLIGDGDRRWARPLPPETPPSTMRRVADEAAWLARYVVPKLVRLARGRSSGDGRSAKRPDLQPVHPG